MSPAKTALVVAACGVFVAGAAAVGGLWWWLRAHRDELQQAGKTAFVDGAHFGAGKEAPACVAEAEARLATAGGILGEAANKVFLEGCLKAAALPPRTCDGVPPRSEMLKSSAWLLDQCRTVAEPQQQSCTRLLGAVQERCEAR